MANTIKLKRGSGSDPSASDLVIGEIAIRSDNGKLFTKKDNGTIAEISGSGGGGSDIFINTLSSSSGSGGGSASFNGSATRFTLSNPPDISAQQLIVSINGVIQKPNSGTSPSEGFAIDGTDIIFSAAPATGADFFIITYGSIGVSVPADNSVTSAKIVDGTIVGTDLATNIDLVDNQTLRLGTGNDLRIYHDSNDSYVQDSGTGKLVLATNGTAINLYDTANSASLAKFLTGGSVELYHNGTKKLETTSAGATVTGTLTVSSGGSFGSGVTFTGANYNAYWLHVANEFRFFDNAIAGFGNAGDLKIYHDSSNGNSHINESGSGSLVIKATNTYINSSSDEAMIAAIADGSVELYHNASKKLETTSGGAKWTGDLTCDDNNKIRIGTSGDLNLYHDGSNSYIEDAGTGALLIKSNTLYLAGTNAANDLASFVEGGAVSLYYDDSKKFETTSSGVTVTGQLSTTDTISTVGNLDMSDSTSTGNNRIRLGTGDDLEIYHNGSHSIALNSTGDFYLAGDSVKLVNAVINEDMLVATANGAVNLYYDGSKKFETVSDGTYTSGHIRIGDDSQLIVGTGSDLQISHSSTYNNSLIFNNTNDLYFRSGTAFYFQNKNGSENLATFVENGRADLYYDNSIRIRTQSYGNEFYNQQHKFIHSNSGGVGAYLSLFNTGTAAGGSTGISFGIGNSNAVLDGSDYGEGQIKCFTDSGLYGNLEFNLHVGANRSFMKIVGNGGSNSGAGSGTEGMRGGVAFGNAGIAIDRSWTGQPGIHVFNTNVEGDTDQGTFRFHGWNRSYASYPASSGSDFSVNLVADGTGLSSDERRKTGIATITNALDTITKMRGVSFQFLNRELDPQTHMSMDNGKKLGFIAQEVIPLLPQLILDSGDKNVPLENGWCDRYSMDYAGVTAVLVEAVKELTARLETLEGG